MSIVTFDKLYENYNVLSDAKDKIAEHTKEYLEAIEGTKGSEKEKKLATQIISKFFKCFPSLQPQAIEAIFDVCEDDNASIRIAAMKALPIFCKDDKNSVSKVADILAQLLQLNDPHEYNIASNSLLHILKANPIVVIKCIFKQIQTAENLIRDKCMKFLVGKLKTLDKSILTDEVEDIIITEIKKVLQDVTAEEFIILMPLLISTHLSRSFTGQQELIEIAADQAELSGEFDALEQQQLSVDRLLTCIKFVLPFFSSKVPSTKFVVYVCEQVLPQWDNIGQLERGDLLQLVLLKQLAELSTNCGKIENISVCVDNVFEKLKYFMPSPPEVVDVGKMPLFEFTIVECLLYTFHRLARQSPDFFTGNENTLKDFRGRLTYFSRGVQGCSKALGSLDIKNKNLTEDEILKKSVTPKLLNNLNTLIKDLFYQPPKYKCNVILSFKLDESTIKKIQEKQTSSSLKRHVPITFEANKGSNVGSKHARSNKSSEGVKLYTPPSGKFSNTFQSYGGRGRGRSVRGGPSRRRSSIRNWRN